MQTYMNTLYFCVIFAFWVFFIVCSFVCLCQGRATQAYAAACDGSDKSLGLSWAVFWIGRVQENRFWTMKFKES